MKKPVLLSTALAVLVLLSAVAGCAAELVTAPPSSDEPAEAPSDAGEAEAPTEEVVLRVGSTKPFKTTNKFADYWYGVLSNLTTHDSLIKLGPDMKPVPWIARDWTVSPDSKTFTFTIDDNATWHDGTQVTAEDVAFSIEYYRERVPQAGWMKEVVESVTVEGNDVVLSLSRPYGNLLTEFMTYSIVPEHIWSSVEDPLTYEGDDRVIGSGPFTIVSWDEAAGKFVFVANEDYFQGKPAVDRLEVSVFRNMDALVMALSRGEIDTWWDYSGEFPYTHIPPLLKSGDVKFASATFLGVPAALGFNLEREPLSDIAFRQAVSLAIDYQQIADLVFAGYGSVPTYGFIPPTHSNFNDSIPRMEFNTEKAGELLDSLGLVDVDGDGVREDADGEEMVLTLLTRGDKTSIVRTTEMVAVNLRDVGIASTVKAVDSSTWVATKEQMDFDLVFFRATPWGTLMHAGSASGYFDVRRTGAGVLHNLDVEEYLETCDARLSTAIPEEQEALDRTLQELHQQYLPGIALVWIDSVYPYREGWGNWTIDHIYGGVVNSFSWFTVTKAAE
ncbi:MAG: ABC transporter substrate-binding protein [Chloroflexi bacterium]|nr:ABC transporter substrate-binding protein [Chloroflexota bacterium]